jgi:hypothetical protein
MSGACDNDLDCLDEIEICMDPSGCPAGQPGCACAEGETCNDGLICRQGICANLSPCPPERTGTETCQCTPAGACDPGLECTMGLCTNPG